MPEDSTIDIGVNLSIDEQSYKVVQDRIKSLQKKIERLNAKPRTDFTEKDAKKLEAYNKELEQTLELQNKIAEARKIFDTFYDVSDDVPPLDESVLDKFYDVSDDFVDTLEEVTDNQVKIIDYTDETIAEQEELADAFEEVAEAQEDVITNNEKIAENTKGVKTAENLLDRVIGDMSTHLHILQGTLGEMNTKFIQLLSGGVDLGKLNGTTKTISGLFGGLKKRVQDTFSTMRKNVDPTLKAFQRITLGLLGVRGVFTALRKATTAYMSQNEETAARLQSIWVALGNTIGPVLEWLIKLITTAFGYINAFVRALTGIDMIANANAKALENEAKATKKAGDEQRRQLAAFDEMNKLSEPSSGSGSDSNGPTLMEFPEFDLNLDDLGGDLADRLNKIFAEIDWDKIMDLITNGMQRVVNYLNSFVDKFNFKGLGEAVGNALNLVIRSLYIWYKDLDFSGFGKAFIDSVTGFFTKINWAELFEAWVYKKLAKIDFLTGIIANLDLQAIIDTVGNFFANVDWVGLAERIATSLGKLIGSMFSLLFNGAILIGKAIAKLWDDVKAWFDKYMNQAVEKAGKEYPDNLWGLALKVVDGFLLGIIDAFKDIYNWLNEHFFTPFIEGFKQLFGIHSPSSVMEEQGEYVVEGFKEGISGIWDAVKQYFIDLINNILQAVADLGTALSNSFSAIGQFISNKWEEIKQGARDAWQAIKDVFSPVVNWFSSKFGDAWEKVKEVFSADSTVFEDIKEGISTTFKNIVNRLISGINTIIAWPFNKINRALNTISNIEVLGFYPFSGLWGWNPISVPQIPYLAQGAVIPPNKEFMAILGDQKQGTNVEAPLDTIKQALREVQDENQVQPTPVYLTLDGKVVAKSVIKWEKKLQFNYNG